MITAGRIPGHARITRKPTRWERFRAWRGRLWGMDVRGMFTVQGTDVIGSVTYIYLTADTRTGEIPQALALRVDATSEFFSVGDGVLVEMTVVRKGKGL